MKCFMCNEGKIKTIKFHTYTERECDNCGFTLYDSHIELNDRIIKLRATLETLLKDYTVPGEDAYNLIKEALK